MRSPGSRDLLISLTASVSAFMRSGYRKLMTCLEEDYDLVRIGEGWRMRSKVLAERWRLGEPWLTGGV
ncbi:MAG: hypothetical protein P4L55_12725 [Syntrophobacteraceae bacterium]|nr:hypothetical protein [Syntrophobacteraceae bacterium]